MHLIPACNWRFSAAICAALLLSVVVSRVLGESRESVPPELVVIELRNRPADFVVPLILPHVRGNEVTISGSGRNVILGGMPGPVSEILALIDVVDQPSRRLMVTVAEGALGNNGGDLGTAAGPVATLAPSGTGGRFASRTKRRDLIEVESYPVDAVSGMHTRSRVGKKYYRQLPLVEGEWADVYSDLANAEERYAVELQAHPGSMIFTDVAAPDSRIWFSLRALLLGDQVTIDLAFAQEEMNGYGAARKQGRGIRTTVQGRLGQWLLVSPSESSAPPARDMQTVLATATRATGPLPVWVRVESTDR